MPRRIDAAGAVRRALAIMLLVPLAGCGPLAPALVPLVSAGLGFGTAVVTLDTQVFKSCVAGKPNFDCAVEAPAK